MIIAVDFDGTCVTHEYPNMGKNIGAEVVLKALADAGHQIILYTMRWDPNRELKDAIEWFAKNGITLFGVNENPSQKSWTQSPKPYANLYIDDAALGCPTLWDRRYDDRPSVDWLLISIWFGQVGLLPKDVAENLTHVLYTYPRYAASYNYVNGAYIRKNDTDEAEEAQ